MLSHSIQSLLACSKPALTDKLHCNRFIGDVKADIQNSKANNAVPRVACFGIREESNRYSISWLMTSSLARCCGGHTYLITEEVLRV